MNLEELRRTLIAAARIAPPPARVPFAFEKRVLARLPRRVAADAYAQWSQALWRASAPCAAIMLLLGAWCWMAQTPPPLGDWSQEFDNTVLAAAEPEQNYDFSW